MTVILCPTIRIFYAPFVAIFMSPSSQDPKQSPICKCLGKGDACARAAIIAGKRGAHEDSDAPAVDVAQTYMKHRMVSFSEAIVRLMEAPIVRRFPPVDTIKIMLQFHLEASAGSGKTPLNKKGLSAPLR